MNSLLRLIDPNSEYFGPAKLSRKQTHNPAGAIKQNIKDLYCAFSNRSVLNTIIIDNNEGACFLNFENLIPIPDFTGNKEDRVLKSLTHYLMEFNGKKDVRGKILKDFGL